MGGPASLDDALYAKGPAGIPGLRACDQDRAEAEVGLRQKALDSWQALEVRFPGRPPIIHPLDCQRLAAFYTVCIYRISARPPKAWNRLQAQSYVIPP